jgi:hypothetical protein
MTTNLLIIILLATNLITAIIIAININPKKTESDYINIRSLMSAIVLISIIALIAIETNEIKISSDAGSIGDFFGGVLNPIVSIIAIITLIRVSQRQTQEFKRNIEILESEKQIYEREKLENTLFKLLEQVEKSAENFAKRKTNNPDGTIKKTSIALELSKAIDSEIRKSKPVSEISKYKIVKKVSKEFLAKNNDTVVLMLGKIHTILSMIESQKIENKRKLVRYLINTIYPEVCYLIAVYSLCSSDKSLRRLIRKTGFAGHIVPEYFKSNIASLWFTDSAIKAGETPAPRKPKEEAGAPTH